MIIPSELKNLKNYLLNFLSSVEYSKFYSFDVSDSAKWSSKPKDAVLINGRWKPSKPDGLTIGNNEVFAAIGIPNLIAETTYEYYALNKPYYYSINPSQMSLLVGPSKKIEHFKILFNCIKYQDFFIEYTPTILENPSANKMKYIKKKSIIKTLSQFQEKKLYRIKKTPISVSKIHENSLSISIIDFAPKFCDRDLEIYLKTTALKKFKDFPIICRYVSITNNSNAPIHDLNFGPCFINYGTTWDFSIKNNTNNEKINHVILRDKEHGTKDYCLGIYTLGDTIRFEEDPENIGIYNDQLEFKKNNNNSLRIKEIEPSSTISNKGFVSFTLFDKSLEPNETKIIPLILIPACSEIEENEIYNEILNWDLISLLENTYNESQRWTDEVEIKTSSSSVDDLIDSLLNHLKLHMSDNALHTGSVYYPHNSAFIRDNYQLQRGLVKAGRIKAAEVNVDFFIKSFEKSGLRNSYSVDSYSGHASSKELRVELPAYLSLISKNLYEWTNDLNLLTKCYPMIKECMDLSQSSKNGLFILNSDEQWIWSCYVDEISFYLDNSTLILAALDFSLDLADFLNKSEDKINWTKKLNNYVKSYYKYYYLHEEKRFAVGIDTSGLIDKSLIPTALCRPISLHLKPFLSEWYKKLKLQGVLKDKHHISPSNLLKNGLNLIWDVMKSDSVIRSHSRTCAIAGNTPAYYLYAVSDMSLPQKDDVFKYVINFPNCTGSVNEIHDVYNLAWGTERRRVGDSGILLESILHYLFGVVPEKQSIVFAPSPPLKKGYAFIRDLPIKGKKYYIRATDLTTYYMMEQNLEDSYENPISDLESNEILEKFMFSNDILKEIHYFSPLTLNKYELLIKTDLPGKIRFYPEILTIDLGLEENFSNPPIISYSVINSSTLSLSKDLISYIEKTLESHIKQYIYIELRTENLITDFTAHFYMNIYVSVFIDSLNNNYEVIIKNNSKNPVIVKIKKDFSLIEPFSEIERNIQCKELSEMLKIEDDLGQIYVPHSFLINLNQFICAQGIPNVIIIHDTQSKFHAIRIMKNIAIMKWEIYPIKEWNKYENLKTEKTSGFKPLNIIGEGKNIIYISKNSKALKNEEEYKLLEKFTGFDVYSIENQPFNGIVYIKNNGHVYKDTQEFCEKIGIYLHPSRINAISMHPFGKYRLSDHIGFPANDCLDLTLLSSKKINFYIQGIHHFTEKISIKYDPKKKSKGFIPEKPYCSFYSMIPFAPMEIAASGISSGKNCIKFHGEADSMEHITIKITLSLDIFYHPIQLIGGQRERLLDPTNLTKNADGTKTLTIELNPGRNVHPGVQPDQKKSKKRSFQYVFGRFPKI